jgi:hypothetical protein
MTNRYFHVSLSGGAIANRTRIVAPEGQTVNEGEAIVRAGVSN